MDMLSLSKGRRKHEVSVSFVSRTSNLRLSGMPRWTLNQMSSFAPRWKTPRCELFQDQTKGEPDTLKSVSPVRGKGDGCPSSEGNRSLSHTVFSIIRERGQRGLPLERVQHLLYNEELYLRAYAKLYPNKGAMTKGSTDETVDAMSRRKIKGLIDDLRQRRFR